MSQQKSGALSESTPFVEDEVVAIEILDYSGSVHDLEVDCDHSFVVNSIIAHNCLCYDTEVIDGDYFDADVRAKIRADVEAAMSRASGEQ